ncbi:MAG: hypothetical protein K8L97_31820 [Anaerolineae bacterium]|nr:hypothetical protein [Anaerolineae bacterium]
MRICWLLLCAFLIPTPAQMQNVPVYKLGWITEKAPHEMTVYDPIHAEFTQRSLGVSLDESFRIVSGWGEFFLSTKSGENETELLIFDLHTWTHCTVIYQTEIILNAHASFVIASPDGQPGIYGINLRNCLLYPLMLLPDDIIPSGAHGIQSSHYTVMRIDTDETASIFLLREGTTLLQLNTEPLSTSASMSLSTDQRYLLYGDADQAYLYTLNTGITEPLPEGFQFPYFEGTYVVTSSQSSLAVWEFEDGEIGEQLLADYSILYDHTSRFSPSGRYAYYRDAETAYTHIIDLQDTTRSWVIPFTGSYRSVWSQRELNLLIEHNSENALYNYMLSTSRLTRVTPIDFNGYADWLGWGDSDTEVFFQVDYGTQQAEYYRYQLSSGTKALLYGLPYNSDLITTQHTWSPDHAFLLIEVVTAQPNALPTTCPTLIEIATNTVTHFDCVDAEQGAGRFFWIPDWNPEPR